MSTHSATVSWGRSGADFVRGRYSREHTWSFDGGIAIAASASPSAVPAPLSNAACVDPEEAYVAAISSCHMLTFLYLASRRGLEIESYRDEAVGAMMPNEAGRLWVAVVDLRPRITFGGTRHPSAEELEELHRLAHDECFIASSVRSRINVHPTQGPT